MKVIIPLAGKGTRLRPHTHVTPKPMLRIAGKPVIDYLMDDLQRLGGVEQVVYITGHLKEKVEDYARRKYPFPSVKKRLRRSSRCSSASVKVASSSGSTGPNGMNP